MQCSDPHNISVSQVFQESIPALLFLLCLETYFNCRKLGIYNFQVQNHTPSTSREMKGQETKRQTRLAAPPWHIWLHWYFHLVQNTLNPGLTNILLSAKYWVNVEFMKPCTSLTTTAYIQTERENVSEQTSRCTSSASYPTAIWQKNL